VVERFAFRGPKTAQLAALLASLGLEGRKVLVLTAGSNLDVFLSGRNLPAVEVLPYAEASAYDVLWADATVVEEGALTGVMPEPFPEEPDAPAPAKPRAKQTPKRSAAKPAAKVAKAAKAAKKAAKKSAAKSAAKKSAAKKSAARKSAAKKPAPKKKKGSK
jgi:hypothetical protein